MVELALPHSLLSGPMIMDVWPPGTPTIWRVGCWLDAGGASADVLTCRQRESLRKGGRKWLEDEFIEEFGVVQKSLL